MRKPNLERSVQLCLKLPESWRAKVDLLLFSELEGRVPKGRYLDFFVELLRERFESKQLDLAPFGLPPGYFVRGPKDMIEALERKLKSE